MTKPLCESCRHLDTSTEIRNGKISEWKVCDFFHHWVNRVTEPQQCRDFKLATERTE